MAGLRSRFFVIALLYPFPVAVLEFPFDEVVVVAKNILRNVAVNTIAASVADDGGEVKWDYCLHGWKYIIFS